MSTTVSTNAGVYTPGADISGEATAPVTARTFVAVSGNRTTGGNVAVGPAAAGARAAGVARNTAAAGELVAIARGNSRVMRVTADGAIAAGADVEVGTAGKAKTRGTGVVVGYALTAAASGADAEISLL